MGLLPTKLSTLTTRVVNDQEEAQWLIYDEEELLVMFSPESFELSENYFLFLTIRRNVTIVLSAMSTVLNFFLLLNLLVDKESRTWDFYPIILQAFCDMIGPGVANIIHEVGNTGILDHLKNADYQFLMGRIPLSYVGTFYSSESVLDCVLNYMRVFLNEYSTGLCICASGLLRYLYICHPTYIMEKFQRNTACIISLVTLLALVAITLDLKWNHYHDDHDAEAAKFKDFV